MPWCKVDCEYVGPHITLMLFIPQFDESGTRKRDNKLVFIQLNGEMAVFDWNSGEGAHHFNKEETLKVIAEDFATYYEMIIEGRAGNDMSDAGQPVTAGSNQRDLLLKWGIEDYFSGRKNTMKIVRGKHYHDAVEKALGKAYYNHKENVKARKLLADHFDEAEYNKKMQDAYLVKLQAEKDARLAELYKDAVLTI